jgi:hypothetical protein
VSIPFFSSFNSYDKRFSCKEVTNLLFLLFIKNILFLLLQKLHR